MHDHLRHLFPKMLFIVFASLFVLTSCASSQKSDRGCCKSDNPAVSQSDIPLGSFVEIEIKFGDKKAGSGSGGVVHNNSTGSYVFTAAHVCQSRRLLIASLMKNKEVSAEVMDIDGKKYASDVVNIDYKNDLCLMHVKEMERPALPLANKYPTIGKEYINTASPMGIAEKWGVPIYRGYYSGNMTIRGRKYDMYSFPVKGGSSGSPILTQEGKLAGMVTMKPRGYDNIAIGPKYVKIHNFLHDAFEDIEEGDSSRSKELPDTPLGRM